MNHNKKKVELQNANLLLIEKYSNLKGQFEFYHGLANKIQCQLLNEDVHCGWNSIKKSEYGQNNHATSNMLKISTFCKKRVFPLIINSYTNHGKLTCPQRRPALTTNPVMRLTYQDKWKQIRPKWSTFGLTRQCS